MNWSTAKKKTLLGIAALLLATGTAHARNVDDYQCGKTKVTVSPRLRLQAPRQMLSWLMIHLCELPPS
jgi:hypothetical protein